jgi:hypothetical protein
MPCLLEAEGAWVNRTVQSSAADSRRQIRLECHAGLECLRFLMIVSFAGRLLVSSELPAG